MKGWRRSGVLSVLTLCFCLSGLDAGPAEIRLKEPWFVVVVPQPTYEPGQGPRVLVDEARFTYNTLSRGLRVFGALLKEDGYTLASLREELTRERLADADILVVSNPVSREARGRRHPPIPSAFTAGEISAVQAWVREGGALFLVADLPPYAGAAAELAAAFGFTFYNGCARKKNSGSPHVVYRRDHSPKLADHIVTQGRRPEERVDAVTVFRGQAFGAPADAAPILVLNTDYHVLLTPEPGTGKVPRIPFEHASTQGALLQVGKGRVAVFGDASMFTVTGTLSSGARGMNERSAPQNAQFLLNVMHWLDGRLGVEIWNLKLET